MKDKKMSIKTSILWNTCGSMFYLGCQWLLSILVIRLAGFEDAGTLTLSMSITNMFYSIAIYGMRTFQVADTGDEFSHGIYIFSRIVTGLAAFALCTGFVLINQYGVKVSACILVYMVFRLGEAVFDVYAGFYQKYWRMDCLGKSMVLRGIVMLASCVICLGLSHSLFLTFCVMSVTTWLVILFYDGRHIKMIAQKLTDPNWKRLAVLLKKCFPLVVYLFLNAAICSVPRYFLEKFCGNEQLGIYAAIAAPTLVVQMASTYIFNPFVTAFAERCHFGDTRGIWNLLYRCIKAVALVSAAAVAGSVLLGRAGLRLLLGKEILPYSYLLLPLVVCTILTAFSWLLCGVLTVVKDFRGLIVSNVAAVCVSGAASVLCIPLWGMQGTSIAAILALLTEIVLLFCFLGRRLNKPDPGLYSA